MTLRTQKAPSILLFYRFDTTIQRHFVQSYRFGLKTDSKYYWETFRKRPLRQSHQPTLFMPNDLRKKVASATGGLLLLLVYLVLNPHTIIREHGYTVYRTCIAAEPASTSRLNVLNHTRPAEESAQQTQVNQNVSKLLHDPVISATPYPHLSPSVIIITTLRKEAFSLMLTA